MGLGPQDVSTPAVSVIVPVRDRRELLRRCLGCLEAQTFAEHEVLVVDDGSVDGSAEVAIEAAGRGQPVRLLRSGGAGAVAARALAVREARAPVLAFTDSDCEPAPDWLERGLAHIAGGADLVQGRTEPTRPTGVLERTVWTTRDDGLHPTCNVLYRRSAFEAAGGFDVAEGERLGFRPGRWLRGLGFGEDTLAAWRVRRAGTAVFAPDVLVRHHVFPPDPVAHVLRAVNAGAFPGLVRAVPELRCLLLHDGVWLGSPRRGLLYVAVALAALRHPAPAALAVAAWVLGHARALGPGGRRALPVVLAHDAVTGASLLAGSARARTVVL